jgi:2,5-furandicarboxylate decarboxylase 1
MNKNTFRGWIEFLESKGMLVRIKKAVSARYQLAGLTKKLDGQKAVCFEKVEGYPIPAISNLCFSRDCFCWATETRKADLIEFISKAIEEPKPCAHSDGAPFMENVVRGDAELLKDLPIPIYHEHDAGNYITGGLVIAKDPETGKRNVSIHRLQILGNNALGILMLPRHLKLCYEKSKELGRPLEIAVAIGVDPLTLLSSQAILPFGADELEVANSLHGDHPLEVFRCPTVDIEVPAESEIVIEGKILLDQTAVEGPFGEYPKYYSDAAERPVVRIESICHRNNPMYYTILPASREHLLLGALAREASLLKFIRSCVPSVRGIHLTYGGACRYHLVIGIEKRNEGEAKNAILAAMANNADIKHVVAVDHDVDIFDMEEVEWAVATRVQGDRDIFMVTDCQVSQLDPSATDDLGTKLGVDATVPLGQLSDRFKRIRIPGYEELDLMDFLE